MMTNQNLLTEISEKHVDFITRDTAIKKKAVLSFTEIQSVRSSEKLELVGNKFAEKDIQKYVGMVINVFDKNHVVFSTIT